MRLNYNIVYICSGVLGISGLFLADSPRISAGAITWGEVFTIDDPGDISNPPGSSSYLAVDFNTFEGMATPGGDDRINGIVFRNSSTLGHSFASGPVYDPTLYPGSTGDQDLDDLLDSYAFRAGDPATGNFGFLTSDAGEYQIQLIGIADPNSTGQLYEPDNGVGVFNTGVTLRRGLPQSVIGRYSVRSGDFGTQSVQFRSLNFLPGNPNPGLAGVVIRRLNFVPEPGSLVLIGAGAGLLASRHRKRR